ncbi:hypothetical protein DMH27_05820 [Raoultella planticola]|nr:hypothetical protein [Raoultella planticola]
MQLCLLITGVAWARNSSAWVSSRISSAGCRSAPFLPQLSPGVRFRQRTAPGGATRRFNGTGLSARLRPDRDYGADAGSGGDPADRGETYIANLNADTQIVIAGTDEAMARVAQKALAIGATKAQRLAVSVPSHCALLDAPAAGAGAGVHPVSLQRPRCAYLSGSSARVLWDPRGSPTIWR